MTIDDGRNFQDINTIRAKHKLRLNIFKQEEKVLCTNLPGRFEILRFFWVNVDCDDCRARGGLIKRLLKVFR